MIIIRKTSAKRSDHIEAKIKDNEATVYLYGDIGGIFGVDHLEWVKEFNAIDSSVIHLRIDSDGGDIFAARTMKTAIMQHKAKVIAHIDGLAASAASFVAMGADEIEIVDGGFLMIHKALSFLDILGFFNSTDLDELIADLDKERGFHDKINQSIANDYAKRTGKNPSSYLQMMEEETWLTAEEALENGMVDRIYDGKPVNGKYDLSRFNNVPEALIKRTKDDRETNKHLDKRAAEKALREAGFSRNDSLKIVAKGFQDESDSQTDIVNQDVGDPQIDSNNPQCDTDNAVLTEKPNEKPDHVEDTSKEKPKDRVQELIRKANMITQTV